MRNPMPFLLARLAEDDVVVDDLVTQIETLPVFEQTLPDPPGLVLVDRSSSSAGTHRFHILSPEHSAPFNDRYDPWRLEQDIESRRRIALEHQQAEDGSCITCPDGYPCPTLRYLTWVYSGHRAYDSEWDDMDTNDLDDAMDVARERLDWIDDDRAIADLLEQDIPEDEIASRLGLSLTRVRRSRAYLHTLGGVLPETPEEVIARCVVTRGDRVAMVERLKAWPYTFGSPAPTPAEGGTTGSWDDIEDAVFDGLLNRDEHDSIRFAVDARDE